MLKKLTCCLLLFIATYTSYSQVPLFAISKGGNSEDHAHRTAVDKSGNIISIGRFMGTADFDPGPAVFNLTSNGSSDLFVAKYTSTGSFIWAFRVGGTNRDAAYGVAIDDLNNIYITGYFRVSADFDPGPGSAVLTSNGEAGFDPGWSGEIFVAKYTTNGAYIWAFSVGGSTISDDGQEIIIDKSGDVVIAGFFSGQNVDFDPSPGTTFILGSSTEEMFLAKYTSAGNFVWAKQMGGNAAANETIRQLAVDNADNIYVTGFFTISADFDPGPGTAVLNAASTHEGFVARYNSLGDYAWAYQFGGTGFNQGWSIDVDPVNNALYIAGAVAGSSVKFTAANGTTTYGNPGNNDAFFAKYSLSGNLDYVNFLAGGADQEAYDIVANPGGNCLYVTGYFRGTADFNPGPQAANLTSNGGMDVFLGKYLLDGSYAWAFNIGSGSDDFGFAVRMAGSDVVVNGSFMGSNVDFDPSANTLTRTSAGSYDGFVARYTETVPCGNWLKLDGWQSFVRIGDLDIPGTQITVEAMYNRTTAFTGGQEWAGDLVSKHHSPSDVNYLLRPHFAAITTSNGFFKTPDVCEIELNKTYHAAMTYDGSTLKFYRNGFLLSQVPATGTLFQNNHATQIGIYDATVHNTQFIGYVNEVKIWNVVRTQAQIQANMNTPLPSPATQAGLLAYYSFDNLLNKQGNATWNGTLNGPASINQTNPACPGFEADSCAAPGIRFDFTYKHDVCNPRRVQFTAFGDNLQSPNWSFGDGNISTGSLQPANTYLFFGSYPVRFSISNGVIRDTITKWVTVGIDPADVILTPDTSICPGNTKQLRAKPALSFCWFPTTYLSDPNSPNPVAAPPQSITYTYTAEVTGNNLIVNGDFSAGNTGFSSDYTYTNPNNVTEGEYNVGSNPQAWNAAMSNCRDHTTGNGNMMLVNGSGILNSNVWRQTITVTPNTNYAFSTWIQSLHPTSPAQLQFSVNGQPLGNTINANATPCTWNQFYITWNSGTNTTAVISVVNRNTGVAGNDFALDDISFAPVFFQQDTVRITVEKPVIKASKDTSFCPGASFQLNASGGASYVWSPATGLSNAAIANPVATPAATTKYIVTGTTASGCSAKDSITLTILPRPTVVTSSDTGICRSSTAQLFASGGISYSWSPAATLSNPNIPNPIASPTGYTVYKVKVTDANNCTNEDSVKVSIRPKPTFTVSADKSICEGKSVTLNASGGDQYAWSPAALLNDPASPSPVASPGVSTMFTVLAKESVCNYDSTLTVNVTVNDNPELIISKSNDIDCTNAFANLLVSGANTYSWSPATGLDNPSKNNPVARVNSTTTFKVTGTNQFGCSSSDTITVKVSNDGRPVFEVANAFTPNNDRVNDCFGLRKWARVTELEFVIYNRWGQKVFSTNDPSQCWDGTMNGRPQDSGAFVYVIKAKSACGEISKKGTVLLIR